jgi:hypothetical protein
VVHLREGEGRRQIGRSHHDLSARGVGVGHRVARVGASPGMKPGLGSVGLYRLRRPRPADRNMNERRS